MEKLYYTKAIVIVHGKSELQICQYIKNKLRLPIEIISNSKGETSIQITSIKNTIYNTIFKSQKTLLKKYPIEFDKSKKRIVDDFKIFMIMDTDDCSEDQTKLYKNKEMFKNHWAYDYFYPIYNTMNLEDVLTKAKIPYKTFGKARKKEYINLFPTDPNYSKDDAVQLSELHEKLKSIAKLKISNFDEFIEFCISITK